MIGVGLFYRDGFFRQALENGQQRERYDTNNPRFLALTATPARVELEMADRIVTSRVWQANVGTTRLYLLDTDLEMNDEVGRRVSDRLYGGDREHRMRQELLMGVGGVRAIRQLGYEPARFHLNEGHAGFLALELLAEEVANGHTLEQAVTAIRDRIVFTTHTPVPAGIDRFSPEVIRRYLSGWAAKNDIDMDELLRLGILPGSDDHFNMAAFCVRVAGHSNGVSRLHGEVSRHMFAEVPGGPEIVSVTNGVHARTWVTPQLQDLFDDKLGTTEWHLPDRTVWQHIDEIEDDELRTVFAHGRNCMIEMADRQIGTSPSASPAGLPHTSGRICCCGTGIGCSACSTTRTARSSSCSPARPIRLMNPERKYSPTSSLSATIRPLRDALCSYPVTTWPCPAPCSPAATSG